MRKTRIVVPCYNESQRLKPRAFLSALQGDPGLSFLFVNDGSSDNTLEILTSIKNEKPAKVELLSLDRNSGKAEAVRVGMLQAIEGGFDNVGYWDADLATPLRVIGEFSAILERGEVEAVFGSRVRLLGRRIKRRPLRHYLGRVFATCASILLRMNVYDTQCGAKMFRNSPALKAVFLKPFKVKWIFDVELFARFPLVLDVSSAEVSSKWMEFPLLEWVDVKGSKVKGADFLKAAMEFGALLFYLRTPASKAYRRYLLELPEELIVSRT